MATRRKKHNQDKQAAAAPPYSRRKAGKRAGRACAGLGKKSWPFLDFLNRSPTFPRLDFLTARDFLAPFAWTSTFFPCCKQIRLPLFLLLASKLGRSWHILALTLVSLRIQEPGLRMQPQRLDAAKIA